MEKPPLEKVIEKLEKTDLREWKSGLLNYYSAFYQPAFTIRLNGLKFKVSRWHPKMMSKVFSYSLSIEIDEYTGTMKYEEYEDNSKTKGCRQKMIKDLYENVHKNLLEHREKEFRERLNTFLADLNQNAEMPELKRVITKLEELDMRQWESQTYEYTQPNFVAKTHGLIFTVGTDTSFRTLKSNVEYHCLNIQNAEGDFFTRYGNDKKESIEEKLISNFYDNLKNNFRLHYEKEFKERLDTFLTD